MPETSPIRRAVVVAILLFLLMAGASQSHAARQFKQALPGYKYSFPRDHASHDDFKTEWWYFTGHVASNSGKRYGYELTFFRTGMDEEKDLKSNWTLKNIYLAHFAVSDPAGKRFHYSEKLNRSGLSLADARQELPSVRNEDWYMEFIADQILLHAESPQFKITLLLTPKKKPIVHGQDGISQKADGLGRASHYYSLTRLQTRGLLYEKNVPTAVQGESWMDHEFGSNQLTEKQVGWDWYSIQLNNDTELMLYMMRNADGTIDHNSSGTVIFADGSTMHLGRDQFSVKSESFWTSPRTGGKYPMGWQVSIPSLPLEINIKPLLQDQELVTTRSTGVIYWEGACKATGKYKDAPVEGSCYVEMTGYAEKFKKNI